MNDNQRKVIIGGLLHDIGKVLYRSDDGRNHSQSGYDFLKNDVDIKDQDILDAYELKGLPPENYVVMCTGSQGEPLSALARIANGDHKTIEIDEGDTVIISATPVPGNEKAVTRVVNSLAKIGADVYDKSRARVHSQIYFES